MKQLARHTKNLVLSQRLSRPSTKMVFIVNFTFRIPSVVFERQTHQN
jgi:hypothetical protein